MKIIAEIGLNHCGSLRRAQNLLTGLCDTLVDTISFQIRESSFYDKSHPDNPIKNWHHIVIPYCTGDIHWGNNDKLYTKENGEINSNECRADKTTRNEEC